MPNWCSNHLTVTGPSEPLARMRAEVASKESEFDFEMILPTPRALLDGEGWYNWRVANWGTKWSADSVTCEEISEGQVDYRFYSAWSPPSSIVAALGANFPELSFHLDYVEPGNCFIGQMEVEQGKVTLDECREMSEAEYEDAYGE